jgi:RNA polymerase sigma factor (sigma-70 family)
LSQQRRTSRFREIALPHLKAAYRLARWLTRDHHDAEEVVQEAYLNAFKFFDGYRGGDAQAWVLSIVRNTGYTWLREQRRRGLQESFDEALHSVAVAARSEDDRAQCEKNPETLLLHRADAQWVRSAIEALPVEYREVLVLRELEELSYKEIAAIAEIPIGTVMSRLARARALLLQRLKQSNPES